MVTCEKPRKYRSYGAVTPSDLNVAAERFHLPLLLLAPIDDSVMAAEAAKNPIGLQRIVGVGTIAGPVEA